MSRDSRRRLSPRTRDARFGTRPGGKNSEAGVVGDQMQTSKPLLPRPADPAVANPDLEGSGLPTDQRQPEVPDHRDMTQSLAKQTAEGKIVMLRNQSIPAPTLRHATHRTNRHITQRKQGRLIVSRLHPGLITCRKMNGQTKSEKFGPIYDF